VCGDSIAHLNDDIPGLQLFELAQQAVGGGGVDREGCGVGGRDVVGHLHQGAFLGLAVLSPCACVHNVVRSGELVRHVSIDGDEVANCRTAGQAMTGQVSLPKGVLIGTTQSPTLRFFTLAPTCNSWRVGSDR
jgi:hypothetical protein